MSKPLFYENFHTWLAKKESRTADVLGLLVIALTGGFAVYACLVFTDWWQSYLALMIFYAGFNIALFSGIKPAPWEGSIVFAFFLAVALIYIFLFAVLYQRHCLLDIPTTCGAYSVLQSPLKEDYLYASTVVFTTLGFGDILPKAGAGRIVVATQALVGMTYSATAILIILGRAGWYSARGESAAQPILIDREHAQVQTDRFAHTSKALEDMSTLLSALSTKVDTVNNQLVSLKRYALWASFALIVLSFFAGMALGHKF